MPCVFVELVASGSGEGLVAEVSRNGDGIIRDPTASLPRGSRSEVVVLASTTYVSSMAHAAGSRSLAAELLVIYLVITAVYQLR